MDTDHDGASEAGRTTRHAVNGSPVNSGRSAKLRSVLLLTVSVVSVFLLGAVVHAVATQLVHHEGPLSPADRLKNTNDARLSLIQLLGAVGLVCGLFYTARTNRQTRDAHIETKETHQAERFAQAIGYVGDVSGAVRAGAAHQLRLLAGERPDYWPSVEDVLVALVRERAVPGGTEVGADVIAAMSVIGDPSSPRQRRPLDLRGVHLQGATLLGLNLEYARLDGAVLRESNLTDACLTRASLVRTRLDEARLRNAKLREVDLRGASLRGTYVYNADFSKSDLTDCELGGAVDLTSARLPEARHEPPTSRGSGLER